VCCFLRPAQALVAGETQTVLLLKELADIWQWLEKGKNWQDQRMWFNRTMAGTKYEGMVPAASGEEGSTGKPDGILWSAGGDTGTRDVLALIELKADRSQLKEAEQQLQVYCKGLLTSVLGIAVVGSEMSELVIEVIKYELKPSGVFLSEVLQHGVNRQVINCFPTPSDVERWLSAVRAHFAQRSPASNVTRASGGSHLTQRYRTERRR
jgi:hypothetical protein